MEKEIKPKNGYVFLALVLVLIVLTVASIASTKNPGFLVLILPILLLLKGFFTVSPNSSKVMVLFGEYKGTVKANGFFWLNPFFNDERISLRARNFDSERVKVNDKLGNPILINVI